MTAEKTSAAAVAAAAAAAATDDHRSADTTTAASSLLLLFNLSIRKLAFVGVSFPLITLLTCLATAYVFQYDDVHETHCRVSGARS